MPFLLENTVFTVFSGIIHNPIISVWYYHMPFFSNVETQVMSYQKNYTMLYTNSALWAELV